MAWQLDIVLDLFVGFLAFETSVVASPSAGPPPRYPRFEARPPSPHEGVRALAQLLYENGERVGTRFDDVLPRLLRLADPTAEDVETRWGFLGAEMFGVTRWRRRSGFQKRETGNPHHLRRLGVQVVRTLGWRVPIVGNPVVGCRFCVSSCTATSQCTRTSKQLTISVSARHSSRYLDRIHSFTGREPLNFQDMPLWMLWATCA